MRPRSTISCRCRSRFVGVCLPLRFSGHRSRTELAHQSHCVPANARLQPEDRDFEELTGEMVEAILSQVRKRLAAGGRWIRTLGPPATASFVVGPPTARCCEGQAAAKSALRFSPIFSARQAIPPSRSPMWFWWVAVCRAARRLLRTGGKTHIYLRSPSARPAIR
jgi:hypothetical protein